MDELLELVEKPMAAEAYMVLGWRQWADAGAVSSELPRYMITQLKARKIGELRSDSFYLFQLPGTQGFLRPEIKLVDGYPRELSVKQNEIYFAGDEHKGVYIFLGDEPHLNIERYTDALFNFAAEFRVRRLVGVGGVYGPVPFDKEREISCSYSLAAMKEELSRYAVRFSNYEGGVSIGSYFAAQAARRRIEYLAFYAFAPMYDLSNLSPMLQTLMIEEDYRAWYDVMRRINYMLKLGFDFTDLERKSQALVESIAAKIDDLNASMPQFNIKEQIAKLTADFVEPSFMPLDEVWQVGLDDIFKDKED
jgi:proteasome assembly chaperone (PAC2) family protein